MTTMALINIMLKMAMLVIMVIIAIIVIMAMLVIMVIIAIIVIMAIMVTLRRCGNKVNHASMTLVAMVMMGIIVNVSSESITKSHSVPGQSLHTSIQQPPKIFSLLLVLCSV